MNPSKTSNLAVALTDALATAVAEYEAILRQKDELIANLGRQIGKQQGLRMTEDEKVVLGEAVHVFEAWETRPHSADIVVADALDKLAEAVRAYMHGRANPLEPGSRAIRNG